MTYNDIDIYTNIFYFEWLPLRASCLQSNKKNRLFIIHLKNTIIPPNHDALYQFNLRYAVQHPKKGRIKYNENIWALNVGTNVVVNNW